MAPRLSDADHKKIEAMIQRGEATKQIAQAIPCDPRTFRKARARYRLFESTKAPSNRVGRHKKVTPYKRDALLDRLAQDPTTDRSEMATFLRDKFEDKVSLSTISRLLKDAQWTRKDWSQTVNSHLDVLDERPGNASLDALVDVISNVPILIDVPQVKAVGLHDATRAAKASFPVLIFDLVAEPFGIIIYGPVDRFRDYQICQIHYRW
ncbi:hypothetical protein FCULG_00012599 [Fusarium culmorum]|uniref:Uncharacterized protein n=1 Tax=Fusarium culmorum TaxID=5516 RepID=A0A2T4GG95_FUSCU|nr:hypothetical protein FCULG_00012599 [Fusarium culmorum]